MNQASINIFLRAQKLYIYTEWELTSSRINKFIDNGALQSHTARMIKQLVIPNRALSYFTVLG